MFFLGRLINAIAQVKQMLMTRTTSDSFPKETQELTKASEKIAKNATSKYVFKVLNCLMRKSKIIKNNST